MSRDRTRAAAQQFAETRVVGFERTNKTLRMAERLFGFTPEEIKARDRSRPLAQARNAVALALYLNGMTLPTIGRKLGDRYHTTIIFAVERAKTRCQVDPEYAAKVEELAAA